MYKYNYIEGVLKCLVLIFLVGVCSVAVADIHDSVKMNVNEGKL